MPMSLNKIGIDVKKLFNFYMRIFFIFSTLLLLVSCGEDKAYDQYVNVSFNAPGEGGASFFSPEAMVVATPAVSSASDIDCYAIMVEYPDHTTSSYCNNQHDSKVFYIDSIGGMSAINSSLSMTLKVEDHVTFHLLGWGSNNGCNNIGNFSSNESNLSNSYWLGSFIEDVKPTASNNFSFAGTWDASQYMGTCAGSVFGAGQAAGANYYQTIITDSPLSYYRLSADTTDDFSNESIADFGGPVFGQAGATTDGNSSVSFNGSSQYMWSASAPGFQFASTTDFSVEAWVNPSQLSSMQYIVAHTPGSHGYKLLIDSSNNPAFYITGGGGEHSSNLNCNSQHINLVSHCRNL